MTLLEIAEQHLKELERRKSYYQKQVAQGPEGFLSCNKNGKKTKWFLLSSLSGKHTRKLLPKSERTLAAKLAKKTFCYIRLQETTEQIENLRRFIKEAQKCSVTNSMSKQLPRLALLSGAEEKTLPDELLAWKNEPFPSSPPHPENRTIRSSAGLMVRSKAEDMIATELTRCGIPFHYEETLYVGTQIYHPDFRIKHPITGDFIIWEHFGKMDDPEYAASALRKIQQYKSAGYILGVNLIITTEMSTLMLSSTMVQAVISTFFGVTADDPY